MPILLLCKITIESLKLILKEDWVKDNYFISDISGATFESYGVILLSRIPMKCINLHPLTSSMQRHVLIAEYNINGQNLLIGITHLESIRQSTRVRSVQLNEIFTLLADADNSIVMGGF